jgi:N utilization substance protein A
MNNKEIVSMVGLIANEKQIDKELIFKSLEDSLAVSLRKDLGKINIKVTIDRHNGSMLVEQVQEVVADVDYEDENHIKISEASKVNNKISVGGYIRTELPIKDFSRVNAQVFKQVIKQNFKQAERITAQEYYGKLVGQLFNATVKKVLKDSAILVLQDETEGKIMLSEANGYFLKPGSKVRVVLENIENDKSHQLVFSRNSEKYIRAILTQEIPAISDEYVGIIKVARVKGKRTKVVVKGLIAHVDTLRECVGPKAIRVKEVIQCLNGEQVDFVNYDKELGTYINNIMNPLEVTRVVIDEVSNKIYFAVTDKDYSKFGNSINLYQNLATQILEKEVIVKSESEFDSSFKAKTEKSLTYLMEKLNVDEDLALILVEEGFDSVESIAYSPESELLNIDGFDEDLVEELRNIAMDVLKDYNISDLSRLKSVNIQLIDDLNKNGINSREQVADLATDELIDLIDMEVMQAQKIIMEAREIWN